MLFFTRTSTDMENSISPLPAWRPGPPRQPPPEEPQPVLGLSDILFALFRHKKMILALALLGFLTAAAVYVFYPPLYESDAKLLVRYVLDRRTVDPSDNSTASTSLEATADSIINSEVEILTSWDLAVQVAEAIGPKRLLPSEGYTEQGSRGQSRLLRIDGQCPLRK